MTHRTLILPSVNHDARIYSILPSSLDSFGCHSTWRAAKVRSAFIRALLLLNVKSRTIEHTVHVLSVMST